MDVKYLKTRKLEIDLVAFNDDVIFVCEIKRWDFKKFFGHRNNIEYVSRDLKGIIDGFNYSMIEIKMTKKKRVSLLEKIDYIKKYLSKYDLPSAPVLGLVITRLYPPFQKYKDVYFLSYEQLNSDIVSEIISMHVK